MGTNLLVLVSASAAAMVLVSVGYQPLHDYAEYKAERAPYLPIAGLKPEFEPLLIEPLADRPRIRHPGETEVGYSYAEYHPGDGSVTLTYDDTYYNAHGMHLGYREPSGQVHNQTYHPGQTFAYACQELDGFNRVGMFQYRGAGSFHGATTLKLVHFDLLVPDTVPCDFPGYLVNTVDIYDAGWFDGSYDLEPYGGPPENATEHEIRYVLPVRHMVKELPFTVDAIQPKHLPVGPPGYRIDLNPDGSITVEYTADGVKLVRTYEPGQSFVTSCLNEGDTTMLGVHYHRGVEEVYGKDGTSLVLGWFKGYTKSPVPCTYPDYVTDLVDVVDAGMLDRHYYMKFYDWSIEPFGGPP
ncbi:MAG: hypothetical protein MPI95_04780 [Nitrosopumilus sp.]|nr:hypothetical protein [Nitrosopumilus sp.]MDA7943512.1 hypothetical protein [Nitrosopumilus sp.]MDA7953383.1 hypothetical protein [Nitrosopumilus sp.]MDA7958389.1 hypothetical protein [Nitrosopumilus sp.]MDA7959836.1 hypothetical protein [Nitrosopumilus sp.]